MDDLLKDPLYLFSLPLYKFVGGEEMGVEEITAQCPAPIDNQVQFVARTDSDEFIITIQHRKQAMETDKDQKIERLERALQEIGKTAETAMDEAHDMVGAKMLMSVRWIGKLAARALGKEDD